RSTNDGVTHEALKFRIPGGGNNRDTKAQRHKEGRNKIIVGCGLLCASVPLCLCVFLHSIMRSNFQLRTLVAFEHRLQLELGRGRDVRRDLDRKVEGEISGLRDKEFVLTLRHHQLRYAAFVADSSIWMHHYASTAERSLSLFVDGLDRHHVFGFANDSD